MLQIYKKTDISALICSTFFRVYRVLMFLIAKNYSEAETLYPSLLAKFTTFVTLYIFH